MSRQNVSRRGFLGGTLLGSVAPYVYSQRHTPTPEDFAKPRLRKKLFDRVLEGRQIILEELKPSRDQLQHGLELHYDSYVADMMGAVYIAAAVGAPGERLEGELAELRRRAQEQGVDAAAIARKVRAEWRAKKPFESAFDPGWQEDCKALYDLAGLDLAVEDNAGHYSFGGTLRWMASSKLVYANMDNVTRVVRAADLQQARRQGKLAVLSQLQDPDALWVSGKSVQNLDLFYGFGVRMAQLTHGQNTAVGGDAYQLSHRDRGLTYEGKELVRRMNQLGVILDLSHAADRTAMEAIEASSEPVVNSHTACEAVFDDLDQRNMDDDHFRAVAKTAGVVGIYVIAHRLVDQGSKQFSTRWNRHPPRPASFQDFFRHLEHALKVAGPDHVGIGTDITYLPNYSPQATAWSNWPYWTVGMVCLGLGDDEIRKILGGNFLRVAERVLDRRPWGSFSHGPGYEA